eukprot:3040060-Prorocentrum_lima.AAC.1
MKGKYSFTKDQLDKILNMGTPVLRAALDRFPVFGCSIAVLKDLMRVILTEPGRYFHYGKSPKVARHAK